MGKVKEYLDELMIALYAIIRYQQTLTVGVVEQIFEPIAEGRCCHDCDASVVIPYRIAQVFSTNK